MTFSHRVKITSVRRFDFELCCSGYRRGRVFEILDDRGRTLFEVGSRELAQGLVEMLNQLPDPVALAFGDAMSRAVPPGQIMLSHLVEPAEPSN